MADGSSGWPVGTRRLPDNILAAPGRKQGGRYYDFLY
jgi:hypothetical protein